MRTAVRAVELNNYSNAGAHRRGQGDPFDVGPFDRVGFETEDVVDESLYVFRPAWEVRSSTCQRPHVRCQRCHCETQPYLLCTLPPPWPHRE